MVGGEVSALAPLDLGLEAVASVSATYGQDVTFSEPLPVVPPVGGELALRYDRRPVYAHVETRCALAHNRVVRFTCAERPTDGFAGAAVRAGWRPAVGAAAGLRVQLGVENVFGTCYQEHLAISGFAARGRSATVSLVIDL